MLHERYKSTSKNTKVFYQYSRREELVLKKRCPLTRLIADSKLVVEISLAHSVVVQNESTVVSSIIRSDILDLEGVDTLRLVGPDREPTVGMIYILKHRN